LKYYGTARKQAVKGENKHQSVYREKPVYSSQLEEFNEVCAFYEDRDVVVDGNLVSFREEAFTPLHSNFYVSQRTNEKLRRML